MLRPTASLGAVLVLVAASAVLGPHAAARGPASVGSGSTDAVSTGRGYRAEASVSYSGDAAPGGGGGPSRPLPPTCWWEEVDGAPAGDPAAMAGWFDRAAAQRSGEGTGGELGTPQEWQDAVAREAAGEDLTWYRARCRGSQEELLEFTGRAYSAGPGLDLPVVYQAFPAGRPPSSRLDPLELARRSADEMVIPRPWAERNPRSAAEDASLVGVPTWFWVEEEAVGGPAGRRTVRAEAGDLWVEVTAVTDGLDVSGPSGAVECDPERATRAWSRGADDADGCTYTFERSSADADGGVPIRLATTWRATYRASDGSSGELEDIRREATVAVPVAEVQSLVSSAG